MNQLKIDDPISCVQNGGLYQWDELMHYTDNQMNQGICPPGWHIPSEAEWNTLFDLYAGNAFAGDSLKVVGNSGFNALFTGVIFNSSSNSFPNFATYFWSSTKHGPEKAWSHSLNDTNHSVSYYPSLKNNSYSVRCIRNYP